MLKTQSESFMNIRKKVRKQMNQQDVSYSQILKSIEEKENDYKGDINEENCLY